jgi:hypothetical protein
MMTSKGLIAVFFVVAALIAGDLSRVLAQQPDRPKPEKGSIETRAQSAGQKKGGDEPQNKQQPDVQTRQGPSSCDVVFVNNTGWYIHRVYVDGRRVGSVGRNSSAVLRDESRGRTELYAEADFTDGPTRSWGPYVFDCEPWTTFTWRLR